ncbi:MAG: phage protein Gp27 family protein [Bacteroidota bacterium]
MNLSLAKSEPFSGVTCDFYRGDDDIWMTREQIGLALEYENPEESIKTIHSRHRDRLDRFSRGLKLIRVEGGRQVEREVTIYTTKGVYEICRWSRQPKANEFMDFVWNVMESLRTGRIFNEEQVLQLLDGLNKRLATIEAKLDAAPPSHRGLQLLLPPPEEPAGRILRKHYAVEQLPADLRAMADRAIEDGVYYRDIEAMLAAKGHKIGKSSIARYGKKHLEECRKNKAMAAQVYAIVPAERR